MFYLIVYLLIALVVYVMAKNSYIFPWTEDRVIILSGPVASFFWPLGFVLCLLNDLFGIGNQEDFEDK